MTTERYLELADEVHKWGFSPNAVAAIRTLVAERDALKDALEGVMYWDNGKPEWETARGLLHNAEVRG